MLSWTPVCCLNYIGDHAVIPVPWVDAFYKPVVYLYNETLLSSPLRAWEEFCLRLFPLDLDSSNPETPNHALQRTAPRVTVAAILRPGVFTPSHLFP